MNSNMYEIIVNSLSAHVAVLDDQGFIIETNRAWHEYGAKNGLLEKKDCVGINYLDICETAQKAGEEEGESVALGIRKVLRGELSEFMTQYPCHEPTKRRWFNLRILPYLSEDKGRIIIVHEDITPIIMVQEELQQKERELQLKSEQLEEMNVALKVLLAHRERDLRDLEERITANIHELVLPYVEKLKKTLKGTREQTLTDIVEAHLRDIVSPFLNRLSSIQLLLTAQEIEIAAMVRQGKSSQEIADVLRVSPATISFHRKNLRRKLGLHDRAMNLRNYLLSLQ